jgi:hypothetical protein
MKRMKPGEFPIFTFEKNIPAALIQRKAGAS